MAIFNRDHSLGQRIDKFLFVRYDHHGRTRHHHYGGSRHDDGGPRDDGGAGTGPRDDGGLLTGDSSRFRAQDGLCRPGLVGNQKEKRKKRL